MIVTVGSQNNAKLLSVKYALTKIFPHHNIVLNNNTDYIQNEHNDDSKIIYIKGFNVDSEISAQPMSDEECIIGATNRANNALKMEPTALYGIGIEGGAHKIGNRWFECGWIIVKRNNNNDSDSDIGIASSSRLELSDKIINMMVNEEIELGTVMDRLSGKESVKTNEGAMGLLTNNSVTRSSVYCDGIILAFSKFISDKKYWI